MPGGGCSRLLARGRVLDRHHDPPRGASVGALIANDRLRPGAPASTPACTRARMTGIRTSRARGWSLPRRKDESECGGYARIGSCRGPTGSSRPCCGLLMQPLTRRDWRGAEHLPRDRRVRRSSPNHLSYVDPIAFAHFLYDNGHPPFFLGKESVFRIPVARPDARAAPSRSRSTAAPARRPRPSGPRWTRCDEGKCVADLPRGHADPRPRPVADDRQDRRRARRADHRVPAGPGGAVGCAGAARAVRPQAPALPAQDDARVGRAARGPGGPARPPARRARCCARPRTGSWTRSPPCWSRSAASRRPAERFDTRAPGCPRPATPAVPRPAGAACTCPEREDPCDEARSRVRHRQLGHGVRRDPGRRRQRRSRCGAGAPRWSTRSTPARNADYLPELVLPDGGHAPPRTRPRRSSGADIVVLAVPSQTLRANLAGLGRRCCRRTPRSCR